MNIRLIKKHSPPGFITIGYYLLCFLLFSLLIFYIKKTAINVIFMDEPRYIVTLFDNNISFQDLWSASANGSQRALGYYLILLINSKLFGINVKLNMYLGSIFILLSSILFANFFKKKGIDYTFLYCIPIIIFGLNKWEYITIGSSMPQFISIFCIYLHFITIDNFYIHNKNTIFNKLVLNLLPFINIILFAGGYSALYSLALIICYFTILVCGNIINRKQLILNMFSLLIPIIIYSSNLSSIQNSEITNFIYLFFQNPLYFFKFFFISLTGGIIGIESSNNIFGILNIVLIGIFIFILYLHTLYIFFSKKIFKKTMLPLLLIMISIISSILITYSRSNFGSIIYGASSRYSTVSEMGIIGIIITYMYVQTKSKLFNSTKILIILTLLFCSLYTTADEIRKSPHRYNYFQEMKYVGLNYNAKTDQELEIFQSKPDITRKALDICKKNKWNIFLVNK